MNVFLLWAISSHSQIKGLDFWLPCGDSSCHSPPPPLIVTCNHNISNQTKILYNPLLSPFSLINSFLLFINSHFSFSSTINLTINFLPAFACSANEANPASKHHHFNIVPRLRFPSHALLSQVIDTQI